MLPMLQYSDLGFDSLMADGDAAMGIAALGIMMVFFGLFILILYIYSAITMMAVAKRLKTPNAWLAWVPIANVFLTAKMAGMHWWPILLMLPYFLFLGISIVLMEASPILATLLMILAYLPMMAFAVFTVIWQWKICERRNRPGWWVLIGVIIPIWTYIMWGILAWSKD